MRTSPRREAATMNRLLNGRQSESTSAACAPAAPASGIGQMTRPVVAAPRLLLTTREAALALAISPRLLWELTARGDIPCLRLPGRGKARAIRYAVEDLQRWIEKVRLAEPGPS